MGRPERERESPRLEMEDIDFAWDETFPSQPPPRPSSDAPQPAAQSVPPPHPRTHAPSTQPPPSASGVSPLRSLDSSPAVTIGDLPEQAGAPRETMITLTDEDPLRHDVGYSKDRDITRDSMPTIPDINPLRHDLAPDTEPQSEPPAPATDRPRRPA